MKTFLKGAMLWAPVSVALALVPSVSAATISINDFLTNKGFENGNQTSPPLAAGSDQIGCPVSWVCEGSPDPGWKSFVNTPATYASLPAGNGTAFASGPTPSEGSGFLRQTPLVLVAGNEYTLNFWVGTPLHVPGLNPGDCGAGNPQCVAGKVGLFSVTFSDAVTLQTLASFSYDPTTLPNAGVWAEKNVSFIAPGGANGHQLLVTFRADGGANDNVVNLDMPTGGGGSPEPSSMILLGLGLVGVEVTRRVRKKA